MKLKAFTLIEILIVVILLGILAAIIIPQFGSSSDDARLSAIKTDLSTVRTQLQLYRTQHNNSFPTSWEQMQSITDQSGAIQNQNVSISADTVTVADATNVGHSATNAETSPMNSSSGTTFGPYIATTPTNQFNNLSTVTVGTGSNPKDDSSGWYYNSTTGRFSANCSNTVGSVVVGDL